MWCVAALIVSVRRGSQITRSASEPGAIVPFRGYSPKIRAGSVAATATRGPSGGGRAAGHFGELGVAALVGEGERAVVRGHRLQVAFQQRAPQALLRALVPERRAHDEARAVVLIGGVCEEEVL